MNTEPAVAAMLAVIAEEQSNGCCMAHEMFIEPTMRRWRSYDRRLKLHKDKSLEHRTQDLEKGLVEWYIAQHGYGYDPACIGHLAKSFAAILAESEMGSLGG